MERGDFLRVCNRPNRYITRPSAYAKRLSFEGLRAYYSDKPWMTSYLDSFASLLQTIQPMRPYAAINYIRKAGGYDNYLRDYARERRINEAELLQLADEILAGSFKSGDKVRIDRDGERLSIKKRGRSAAKGIEAETGAGAEKKSMSDRATAAGKKTNVKSAEKKKSGKAVKRGGKK